MFSYISKKIGESLYDHVGKVSSATISSYFILAYILLTGMVFLSIDIINLVTAMHKGETYHLPLEHIGVYSLALGHHLILLGIKKSGEAAFFPNITKTIEEKRYSGVNVNTDSNAATTVHAEKIASDEIVATETSNGEPISESTDALIGETSTCTCVSCGCNKPK